jgi:hypothetical protein
MRDIMKSLLIISFAILVFCIIKLILVSTEPHTYVIKTPTNEYTVDDYDRIHNSSCISFYVNGKYKLVSGNFEITEIK